MEFEWTVGPIPYEDRLGREVVVQYVTDLDSGDAFWTDANGREMIKRVRWVPCSQGGDQWCRNFDRPGQRGVAGIHYCTPVGGK